MDTLLSSKSDSTSSSITNGTFFKFIIANNKLIAVKVLSPPESNDIGFAGSIINGSLRIEWYYGNQNQFNRSIDFSTESDFVEKVNIEDYYPKAFTDFINEDFFSYLNFGKYHSNEELLKNDYRTAFRSLTVQTKYPNF